jgi:hypothetical protein
MEGWRVPHIAWDGKLSRQGKLFRKGVRYLITGQVWTGSLVCMWSM